MFDPLSIQCAKLDALSLQASSCFSSSLDGSRHLTALVTWFDPGQTNAATTYSDRGLLGLSHPLGDARPRPRRRGATTTRKTGWNVPRREAGAVGRGHRNHAQTIHV